MPAMEAIDDVKPVLEGFKCFDGLLELKAIERCVLFQTLGYGGIRIKSLVLKKENDAFGLPLWSRRIGNTGKKRGGNGGTYTSDHSLKHFSSIDHSPSKSGIIVH